MFEPTPVRFLAPVALLVAVVATAYVIGSAEPAPKAPPKVTTVERPRTTKKSVRIRRGDTISAIAQRTGIPASVLIRLNPDIDANALPVGERLKLR